MENGRGARYPHQPIIIAAINNPVYGRAEFGQRDKIDEAFRQRHCPIKYMNFRKGN